ncbi:hypothetical protein HT585_00510 [Ensifer sp. HO-A22]|uniref:Adenylate cyclase n=1 Tax=Ensifer oleiphilus TaxID=2742698 RepID=A0A7Y6UKS9_9HYPH|nr:hypothetical protein [Ensifer oleiphilus]NVD37320.1 hypothetical protein [Ensifer oleiphilus]
MADVEQGIEGEGTFDPTSDEILEQLDRIRRSPEFDVPERARNFLSYVVHEALAGRAERIKAYSIATTVFGRNTSFNAQFDPVVRIEAGRVRRALERYYLVCGIEDPVRITIPKGGYAPSFSRHAIANANATNAPPYPALSPATLHYPKHTAIGLIVAALLGCIAGLAVPTLWSRHVGVDASQPAQPTLIVRTFEDLTAVGNSAMITRGLGDEVVRNIAKFKEITVIANERRVGAVADAASTFALEGRVRIEGQQLRLSVRVLRQSDGAVIWAENYDESLLVEKIIRLQEKVAASVATAIAQPYGILFQANAQQMTTAIPDSWEAYACTLSYYSYRSDLNSQTHHSVQNCLEQATKHYPNYATAWALLSLTYLDEMRFRYRASRTSNVSLDLASQAAAHAVEHDPQNVRGLQAQMLVLFFRGHVDAALAVGARATALNPNDTELVGEYGFRLALSGQWDQGCELVSKTLSLNPGPVGYFEAAMAVCRYMRHDYGAAERWVQMADLQANPIYHVILLAILGKLRKMEAAVRERRWLETHAPSFLTDIRNEVALRVRRPEDQRHILEGLRQAGVSIPPGPEANSGGGPVPR